MIRQILFTVLVGSLLLSSACRAVPSLTPQPPAMANPASVFCEEQGGKLEIRTQQDGGQYGVCVFAGVGECEEWALFRGECIPGSREKAIRAAAAALAAQLNLDPTEVRVGTIAEVIWDNQCLGLAAADEACAEAITPGFIIELEAQNSAYVFHVDLSGNLLRQANPQP
jgi:putative hemolysin